MIETPEKYEVPKAGSLWKTRHWSLEAFVLVVSTKPEKDPLHTVWYIAGERVCSNLCSIDQWHFWFEEVNK